MKTLNKYITEKFQVSKDYKHQYSYHPETKAELIGCIKEKIDKEGLGTKDEALDLNDIDTSKITDMSLLFSIYKNDNHLRRLARRGTFDISEWDVSNVKNMKGMFRNSSFDGDISDWDVSNVEDMSWMFYFSVFTGKNGDINNWKVDSVKDMSNMFDHSPLLNNPPSWYKE